MMQASFQLEIDQSDKMMYLKCQGLCTDVSWMSKYSGMDRTVLREYDIRGQYWKFQRLEVPDGQGFAG